MRVAINGFGRIGRSFLKRGLEKGIDIVAINDLHDLDGLVNLIKYDSVYGRYNKKVTHGKGFIKIGSKKIIITCDRDPEKLPWKALKIDVVLESTGAFRDRQGAKKHLKAGAKKVLISSPAKNPDVNIVLGVNDKNLKKHHKIISMESCTTNCIAPLIKIFNDKFGIQKGYMTTIHAYTTSQNLLDGPHKNIRRSRAAATNIVPTTSGAASAVTRVIPELKNKLDGMALRVPIACGSITDLVITLKKSVTVEEINKLIKDKAKKMPEILEYTQDELVSTDIIGNTHSSIFDSKLTKVNGNMIKILSWYDNEYGYSCRLVDLIKMLK